MEKITRVGILTLSLFATCCCAGTCFASRAELIDAADAYVIDPELPEVKKYGVPIGTWCVGSVTEFNSVFSAARNSNMTTFNEDISAWDVSRATQAMSMFDSAAAFNQPLDAWDVSGLVDVQSMFRGASSFNQPLGTWDVSNVGDAQNMFREASVFNQPLETWRLSSLTQAAEMFRDAAAFSQDLCAWGSDIMPGVSLSEAFVGTACVSTVSPNLTAVPPGPFCASPCFACFKNRTELIAAVDVYLVDPSPASSAASKYGHPIGTWCLGAVTSLDGVFSAARNPNMTTFNEDISAWDVSRVTDFSELFRGAAAFDWPLDTWDVSRATTMAGMFRIASSFNRPLGTWDISNVINMGSMFQQATSFDQNIEPWDVSTVTNTARMFDRAASFNQPLNAWNVSSVASMRTMFAQAPSFNRPLDSWDVSSVTTMSFMFAQASAFNQPLDPWDVSSVTSMTSMFEGASAFDQPLDAWNVSSILDMTSMFEGATSFSQNLCPWGQALQAIFQAPVVANMFVNTSCAITGDPVITDFVHPLCASCEPTVPRTTVATTTAVTEPSTTISSTTTAVPVTLPPAVSGNITVGDTTVASSTNVTQGSTVVVQGTLMVVPGSQLNVGDGGGQAVFQVTGDATVSGGSANVALSEKPPPDTPITVELIEGASVSGSFDDITASVPGLDPNCESLNVEQQTTGTSISAIVTLTNICVGGLHPGALAGIIVGIILVVALAIGLPIYLHERKQRKQTESSLQRLANAQ